MKLVYANITGGLLFTGDTYGQMIFDKRPLSQSLGSYVRYFKRRSPDILCLSEVHLETKYASEMVEYLASALGLPHHRSLALSDSHLDPYKQKKLGMAVLSRYPILGQEEFTIPSPGLEVIRPDGAHWKMFDKGGQRVFLDVDGRIVGLVNFSYFPFYHFKRKVNEPAFRGLRRQLLKVLQGDSEVATIITGDFNQKGFLLKKAFPELFTGNALAQAVTVPTTVVGAQEQLDHILYPPKYFTSSGGFAEQNGSDHLAIGATFQWR